MKQFSLFLACLGLFTLGCDGGNGGGNGGSGGTGGTGGAGGTGGTGGAQACTEIGCNDGFTLTLTAANGTFTAGEYTLDTDLDGTTESCTITIGAMVDSTCNALIDVTNTPNRIDILYGGTPASVGVVVALDGTEVFNQTYTPEYMEVQPNGEGCPPVCMQAGAEISL